MFRIWIFLLLQRQSPRLGSADTPQQDSKSFLGIRRQPVRACRSIPLPQAELEQLIPRESHFSQPCPGHHPPGPKLSQECSLLMPAAGFPRKPPETSLRRVMATQARLGCIHTSDRTAPG